MDSLLALPSINADPTTYSDRRARKLKRCHPRCRRNAVLCTPTLGESWVPLNLQIGKPDTVPTHTGTLSGTRVPNLLQVSGEGSGGCVRAEAGDAQLLPGRGDPPRESVKVGGSRRCL